LHNNTNVSSIFILEKDFCTTLYCTPFAHQDSLMEPTCMVPPMSLGVQMLCIKHFSFIFHIFLFFKKMMDTSTLLCNCCANNISLYINKYIYIFFWNKSSGQPMKIRNFTFTLSILVLYFKKNKNKKKFIETYNKCAILYVHLFL
jgi:hypothetical protein